MVCMSNLKTVPPMIDMIKNRPRARPARRSAIGLYVNSSLISHISHYPSVRRETSVQPSGHWSEGVSTLSPPTERDRVRDWTWCDERARQLCLHGAPRSACCPGVAGVPPSTLPVLGRRGVVGAIPPGIIVVLSILDWDV